jgi:membrane protease subunit HflC
MMLTRLQAMILGGLSLLVVLINTLYIVDQRQQVLVLQFGEAVDVVQTPGLKMKIPFVQQIQRYDTRILNVLVDDKEVIALDQKRLIVNAFAKYRIVDPLKFYQSVRDETGARIRISSILDSSLRQILGGVKLRNLLSTERVSTMRKISTLLNEQAKNFGVAIIDVRIMRADLPEENSQATYARMITDRKQQASKIRAEGEKEATMLKASAERQYQVLLAEADRAANITRGEGDAQASRIYADAFGRDPEFFAFFRTLQSYRATLGKEDTTMVVSPQSPYLRLLMDGR